jgi:hypothetical protein
MSKLHQLLHQWSKLSDAADELQLAGAEIERAHTDQPQVSQLLHDIEVATSEILSLIDMRIAETLPANPREAAILAAFARRAHNENDRVLASDGRDTGERVFDEALSMSLTNLVTYLVDASDTDLSRILDMWCIPRGEEPAGEERSPSPQHCQSGLGR